MARILVIEDDRNVLLLLHKVIATLPGEHDVVDAANVYDALDHIKNRAPDLIMLDCLLARATTGNGFMVYFNHLRQARAIPEIPILLVSGMPLKQLEGLKAAYPSIKRVFQKPFDVVDLRSAICEWLGEQPTPLEPSGVA